MANNSAKLARQAIDVPWDELRSARVHKRMLEALRSGAAVADEYADDASATEVMVDTSCDGETARPDKTPCSDRGDETRGDGSASERISVSGTSDNDTATDDANILASVVRPIGIGGNKRWWILAAVLTAAAILLWIKRPQPSPHTVATNWTVSSTLRFADGSRSLLDGGAHVEVVKDSAALVRVKQAVGRVRYEVTPRKQRQFVVAARGVEVTVVGTAFEVNVDEHQVRVRVLRGIVRVRQGARVVQLVAGEHIAMEAASSSLAQAQTDSDTDSDTHPTPPPAPSHRDENSTADVIAPSAPNNGAVATAAAGGGAHSQPSNGRDAAGGNTTVATAQDLLRVADSARSAGNLHQAAQILRQLIDQHPHDRRITLAMFTLGKVERQRGRHLQAAQAFEGCGAALRGDALAAAAAEWRAAGNGGRARAAASHYLAQFPDGVHAPAMRAIVQ